MTNGALVPDGMRKNRRTSSPKPVELQYLRRNRGTRSSTSEIRFALKGPFLSRKWQAYLDRTRQRTEQVKEALDRTKEILGRPREHEKTQGKSPNKLDRLFGRREPTREHTPDREQQQQQRGKRDQEDRDRF